MAQVIQAACPGCKAVLKIPADWVQQAVRCKNCNMVVQVKAPRAPRPAPSTPTPPPRSAVRATAPAAPAAAPTSIRKPPALPARSGAVVAKVAPPPLAPPLAIPVGATTSAPLAMPVGGAGPSFDFAKEEGDRPARGKGRRKRGGGPWKGLAVVGSVLLLAGILTAAFWSRIKPMFDEATTGQASVKPADKDTGMIVPPPKGTKKGPRKAPDGAPRKSPVGPKGKEIIEDEDPPPVITPAGAYPRRALIISVHDYLYANPLQELPKEKASIDGLIRSLDVLKIPQTQITHLSDRAKRDPRPPMKPVIEAGLRSFLATSRAQDRIMVFFVGHSVQIENEAYLVPLEGELDDAKTLIPLKWVYAQLAACKARQKIFVFDGNRFNPGQGLERPGSGPMGEKVAELLKAPPPGVEVWASCSAGQTSFADDFAPVGVFLDHFRMALYGEGGKRGVLEGRGIPKPDDLIPMKVIQERVSKSMAEELSRRKDDKGEPIKQLALLAGSAPKTGAKYDRTEAPAVKPALPMPAVGNLELVKAVLDEISVPPLKPYSDASMLNFSALPPFSPDALKKYEPSGDPNSELRKVVHKARVTLWAVSTAAAPPDLMKEVTEVREKLKVDLSVMKDSYNKPAPGNPETQFKARVGTDSTKMAKIVFKLIVLKEELESEAMVKMRDAESPRWQANYDFIKARLLEQMAYLEEYQALLGQMRKELPPLDDKLYGGWRLASTTDMQGGREATAYSKPARKTLEGLASKHRGTPWEVLAKREKLTALGLKWQSAR